MGRNMVVYESVAKLLYSGNVAMYLFYGKTFHLPQCLAVFRFTTSIVTTCVERND